MDTHEYLHTYIYTLCLGLDDVCGRDIDGQFSLSPSPSQKEVGLYPRLRGHAEIEQKDGKSQRVQAAAVRASPRNIRSLTQKVPPKCLPKHGLKKGDTNGLAKLHREKPTRPQPYTKNCIDNKGRLMFREVTFPREEQANRRAPGSALEAYTGSIIHTECVIFRKIYVCP